MSEMSMIQIISLLSFCMSWHLSSLVQCWRAWRPKCSIVSHDCDTHGTSFKLAHFFWSIVTIFANCNNAMIEHLDWLYIQANLVKFRNIRSPMPLVKFRNIRNPTQTALRHFLSVTPRRSSRNIVKKERLKVLAVLSAIEYYVHSGLAVNWDPATVLRLPDGMSQNQYPALTSFLMPAGIKLSPSDVVREWRRHGIKEVGIHSLLRRPITSFSP